MTEMSVWPYQEITFDADGDVDLRQRDLLADMDVTDLVMFSHGWNTSRSGAARLYSRFFQPFPALLAHAPGVRVGYAGIVWPSMRFTDEPIPDFEPHAAAAAPTAPGLDPATRAALTEVFPGRDGTVARLAVLLDERPASKEAFDTFGELVRTLVAVPSDAPTVRYAADLGADGEPGEPWFLRGETIAVCRQFSEALIETGAKTAAPAGEGAPLLGGLKLDGLWDGAKELLRQATYYAMKRRAGTVGRLGLGPVIGHLAHTSPATRVHLVGHSFGARLVAFALRGLPGGVGTVKSVTLLQGAFSHYAFAPRLPHAPSTGGALRDLQHRVDGPLVACYSRHDTALSVLYPLASKLADDPQGAVHFDKKWWAVGHDGIQAVAGTPDLTLADALRDGFPSSGCVNVDAAAVVRRGGPPSGAHSDICHEELARVVLSAGRIGR
ncbi:alpha/beta hydrolase [Streptomyces sannanensis]|uniref:Alpha/beta hydrolase n=1 Tax=Streptomyces sannanensis TaxID=285536 RepID=A0ABP6SJ25_9ACTN